MFATPYTIRDRLNTTNIPLLAGERFIGEAVEILKFGIIFVTVYSDKDSAEQGLSIEQSQNGIDWDSADTFSVFAGKEKNYSLNPHARYYRVCYTNGAEDQGAFRLQSICKQGYAKPSSHRINDTLSDDDDATLNKSVIAIRDDNGTWQNAASTINGNFKVAIEEYGDTPSVDAFARLRVSAPFTIFDSKQLHDKQPLFWDELLGGSATSIHSSINAETKMTVTTNSSDYVIRQTKQRFNYQPGKGQLIFMTFHSPQATGITSRIGLFDGTGTNFLTPNNGVFFECDGALSWNIAKNGTTTETVAQSSWNVDKLDGSGVSGKTLDLSDSQILIIDYEWLGVGRVRVGFVIDGLIYYCHYFNHANNNYDSVYMSTPNLPLRYSIETDGSNESHLDHICSTVISEGGIEKTGILRVADTGNLPISTLNTGDTYAIIGLRLKSDYIDISVIPESISVVALTNDYFKWELHLNPTVAGTFTYNDLSDSSCQYAIGGSTNSISLNGVIISSGFASVDTQQIDSQLQTALKIGSTIAGVRDQLILCVRPLSNNLSIGASLNFRELL